MGGWVVQFQLDKIFHLLSHAIAIFLILIAFVPAKTKLSNNTKQIFYVFLSMLFFGIFIEYFQQNYITGRMFDVLDIVANILGDFSGLLLFFYSNKVLKQ